MSRSCRDLDSIREVLIASIGSRVTIILSSGRILRGVEIEAVSDDLVIASFDGEIITINIRRIDAVITRCRKLLGTLLSRRCSRESRSRSRESCIGSRVSGSVSRESFIGSRGSELTSRGAFESSRSFGS